MGRHARVLLIEDDPDLGPLIVDVLGSHDVEIVLAPDPARLPSLPSPSLVVTDLFGSRWYERDHAVRHVASLRQRFPGVPIVVLTAHTQALEDVAAIQADAVVGKPFDVEDLTRIVISLMLPVSDASSGVPQEA